MQGGEHREMQAGMHNRVSKGGQEQGQKPETDNGHGRHVNADRPEQRDKGNMSVGQRFRICMVRFIFSRDALYFTCYLISLAEYVGRI